MNEHQQKLWRQVSLAAMLVALLFSGVLGGLLAWTQSQGKVAALVNAPELARLHEQLRKQPKDEALKQQIRALDLQLRQSTFQRLNLSHAAARALFLGGLVLFLIGAHGALVFRPRPAPKHHPHPAHHDEEMHMRQVTALAVVAMLAIIVAFVALLTRHPAQLPAPPAPANSVAARGGHPVAALPAFPSTDEVRKNWPSFRGHDGSGVNPTAHIPTNWNAAAGVNIRWQTAIPLPGLSSPIIWGNALFLTGADEASNCVYRFDADTGQLLWNMTLKVAGGARPAPAKVSDDTGLAAPTPVTDGRRVYALFPNGEIAAFDFAGKQIWARNIGPLENSYGFAASLALYQDRLLIQIDRGVVEDNQSKLLALDAATGKDLWQKPRAVAGSWSSPIIVEVGGQPQLLTCAAPLLCAYNPLDGAELWRVACLESDVAPSPILASNMIVAVAPNTALFGVKPGEAKFTWKAENGVPDATSPVSDGQRFYIVDSEGMVTCSDLQTGKARWQHEIEDHFYASPMIAGDKLILLSRKGVAYLLRPGDKFELIGKGEVGKEEECGACPTPFGNRLYIRGKLHLFCIEAKDAK
jgi:outer membrane protein assembly factor BamB